MMPEAEMKVAVSLDGIKEALAGVADIERALRGLEERPSPCQAGQRRFETLCVDEAKPALERLLAALDAVTPTRIVADPVVVAAEAAVGALYGMAGSGPIGEAVLRLLPPNATPFERGLAIGMALILGLRNPLSEG